MFKKILIANRGEIACRIMRTAKAMGMRTVAVYSDADAASLHVAMADEAYRLGPPPVLKSYLLTAKIIEACQASGADAVHPGYGFLAENPEFVEAVEGAGLTFIGPSANAIRQMGLKDAAKTLMEKTGVPIIPGYHGDNQDPEFLSQQADEFGYPVMIKARAGGGGIGMRRVNEPSAFQAALKAAQREAKASFGDPHILIEKYIDKPRHIEFQIFGDSHGNIIHLFERDCSLQRRHQKVIEEAPAPNMSEEMRAGMGAFAVRAAEAIQYEGAGTVEFIADTSEGLRPDRFYFMEMNTRLQVEHPVTEFITGQDLVEWQFRVAAGEPLPVLQEDLGIDGWSFEARIYAEDAAKGFLPATGRLTQLSLPAEEKGVRVESGVRQGDEITPYYDPMIAKLIVHGATRAAALNKLSAALTDFHVSGTVTNIAFLTALAAHEGFAAGDVDVGLIERDLPKLLSKPNPPGEAFAIGALAVLGLTGYRDETDPWGALIGWRHWRDAKQYALLDWQGEPVTIPVVSKGQDTYLLDLPTGEIHLTVLERRADGLSLRFGERIMPAKAVVGVGEITVIFAGQAYTFGLANGPEEWREEEAGGDHLISPMPGLVKLVSASDGAIVSRGDVLIVLEAMKMEHALTAPRDGKISRLYVTEGEQVEDGTILLELETQKG